MLMRACLGTLGDSVSVWRLGGRDCVILMSYTVSVIGLLVVFELKIGITSSGGPSPSLPCTKARARPLSR
jgi:hypothetical protein